MLSLLEPRILPQIRSFELGIWTWRWTTEDRRLLLIIKAPKDFILTARERQGFSFFVHYLNYLGTTPFAITTAFFDDKDQPLALWTPVSAGPMAADLLELVNLDSFDVYFFDNHNRELLAYSCVGAPNPDRMRRMKTCSFPDTSQGASSQKISLDLIQLMKEDFGQNFNHIDRVDVRFSKSLMPEDVGLLFVDDVGIGDSGALHSQIYTLDQEDVGQFQELDIAKFFQKSPLPRHQLLMNPRRPHDGNEFVDVLVVAPQYAILVQAKDSPNTKMSLDRSFARKVAAGHKQIQTALRQVRRSVRYLNKEGNLKLRTASVEHSFDLRKHLIINVIVVKELLPEHYEENSKDVLKFARQVKMPCILIDFPTLASLSHHARDVDQMAVGLINMFEHAVNSDGFSPVLFRQQDREE